MKVMNISIKKKTVLVVDDNENMAKCLSEMIEIFGLSCVSVNNGEEALRLLETEKFSLIIADSNMPKVSGLTLLKKVKKNYPDIQIAIMSTRNSEMTQNVVFKYKPDFYLTKPFKTSDIEQLLYKI